MDESRESNGRTISWKWLAGILVALIIALLAAWGNDITRRIGITEVHVSTQSGRIAAVENTMGTILWRVERIDNKLDKLDAERRR